MELSYNIIQESLVVSIGSQYTTCVILETTSDGNTTSKEQLGFTNLKDTPSSYENQKGKTVYVSDEEDGLIFGKAIKKFTDLEDTIANLSSRAGQLLMISADGTRITSVQYSPSDVNIELFTQLGDTFSSYTGNGGKIIAVRDSEDGLEAVDITAIMPSVGTPNSTINNPVITLGKNGEITNVSQGSAKASYGVGEVLVGNGTINPVTIENPDNEDYVLYFDKSETTPVWRIITGIGGNAGASRILTTEDSSGAVNSVLKITRNANGSLVISNIRSDGTETALTFNNTNIYLSNSILKSTSDMTLEPTGVINANVGVDDYIRNSKENTLVLKKYVDNIAQSISTSKLQENIANDGIITIDKTGILHRLTIIPTSLDSDKNSTDITVYDSDNGIVIYTTAELDAPIDLNEIFIIDCMYSVSANSDIHVKSTSSTSATFSAIAELSTVA